VMVANLWKMRDKKMADLMQFVSCNKAVFRMFFPCFYNDMTVFHMQLNFYSPLASSNQSVSRNLKSLEHIFWFTRSTLIEILMNVGKQEIQQ